MKFNLVEEVVDWENIDKYANDILFNMSEDQIIEEAGLILSNSITDKSPMFITTTGKILDVYANCSKYGWKSKYSSVVHSDLLCLILERILKNHIDNYENEWNDNDIYESLFTFFTDDLGWIRLNTGTTSSESRYYMVLSEHVPITNRQSYKINDFLDWGFKNNKKEVLVFAGNDAIDSHIYNLMEYTPNEIIAKLRRFYNIGILLENKKLKEDKHNLSDEQKRIIINNVSLALRPELEDRFNNDWFYSQNDYDRYYNVSVNPTNKLGKPSQYKFEPEFFDNKVIPKIDLNESYDDFSGDLTPEQKEYIMTTWTDHWDHDGDLIRQHANDSWWIDNDAWWSDNDYEDEEKYYIVHFGPNVNFTMSLRECDVEEMIGILNHDPKYNDVILGEDHVDTETGFNVLEKEIKLNQDQKQSLLKYIDDEATKRQTRTFTKFVKDHGMSIKAILNQNWTLQYNPEMTYLKIDKLPQLDYFLDQRVNRWVEDNLMPNNFLDEASIQGLENDNYDYVTNYIESYVNAIIDEYDVDADIIEVWLHGSRLRGNAKDNSDLDAVVFYLGDEREDDFFNILNDDPLYIDSIQIDINPINIENTSIEQYKKDSAEYDKEVMGEEFPSKERRDYHYTEHVVPNDPNEFSDLLYKSPEEYEQAADQLASTPVRHVHANNKDNDTIVGFIQKDGAYVKHNTVTNGTVIYKPDRTFAPKTGNRIITYNKEKPISYRNRVRNNYKSTIK